jgi:DNA polymerase-1
MAVIKRQLYAEVGHAFDLNSPKQLQKVLFDELGLKPTKYVKTGPSTDASVLEHYKHEPVPKLILDFRAEDKLYGTYTKPLREKVHPKTGRIHPNFNIAKVASGRFSCDDPNMENIPKTTEYRECILANFGNSLLKIDFDQGELRELAGQSGGSTMSRIFASGASIHAHTASIIHGIDPATVDKKSQIYLDGKRGNFAILYGATEGKLIEVGLAKDWDEAHTLRQQILAAYPEEMEWVNEQRVRIQRERKAVTLFGRIRTWGPYVPADAVAREGFNHIIQGSFVEHVHIATIAAVPIIRRYPAIGLPRAGLTNQVHDEILIECRDDVIQDLRDEVVPVMENANSSFPIPLTVTPEIGFRWMV